MADVEWSVKIEACSFSSVLLHHLILCSTFLHLLLRKAGTKEWRSKRKSLWKFKKFKKNIHTTHRSARHRAPKHQRPPLENSLPPTTWGAGAGSGGAAVRHCDGPVRRNNHDAQDRRWPAGSLFSFIANRRFGTSRVPPADSGFNVHIWEGSFPRETWWKHVKTKKFLRICQNPMQRRFVILDPRLGIRRGNRCLEYIPN